MTAPDLPSFASALATVVDELSPMLDVTDGHRAELLRRGYSETAAEQMAATFHATMLSLYVIAAQHHLATSAGSS